MDHLHLVNRRTGFIAAILILIFGTYISTQAGLVPARTTNTPALAHDMPVDPLLSALSPRIPITRLPTAAAIRNTGWWSIETVDPLNNSGLFSSAAVSPTSGRMYISYYDATLGDLVLSSYLGDGSGNCGETGNWYCSTLDGTGDVGRYSSLAIYAGVGLSKIGVAYQDSDTYALRYAEYSSGTSSWSFTTVQTGTVSLVAGYFNSLRFDASGQAHIAYYQDQDSGDDALFYASYIGSGEGSCSDNDWSCSLVTSGEGAGLYPSLALDEAGAPWIAYYDAPSGDLMVASGGGGLMNGNCGTFADWQCDPIVSMAIGEPDLDEAARLIAIQVGTGKKHIVFQDRLVGAINYALYPSESQRNCGPEDGWDCAAIDVVGFNSLPSLALALDGAGLPVVAYLDEDDGGLLQFAQPAQRLGKSQGNCGPTSIQPPFLKTWQCDTVDDGGANHNQIGTNASLALHSTGLAEIAHYDATNGDLLVARQTRLIPPPQCGGLYPATADTSLYSDAPNQAHGSDSTLQVISTGTYTRTALLNFNLQDTIPGGAVIQRAELQVTLSQTPSPLPYPIMVRDLTQPWDEGTTTWNSQPVHGNSLPARYHHADDSNPDMQTLRVDVTPLVDQWASSVVSQTSLAVLPGGTAALDVQFFSREGGTSTTAPRLFIACSAPNYAIPPSESNQSDLDHRQLDGLLRLGANGLVTNTLILENGALRFAEFNLPLPAEVGRSGLEQAEWFTQAYSDALRLENPVAELQLVSRSSNDHNIFFRQIHQGIPVFPSSLVVQLTDQGTNGRVTGVSGGYIPQITLDPTPRLNADQAEAIALTHAGAQAQVRGDTLLRYLNMRPLGSSDLTTYLSWQVPLGGGRSLFIDANSGAILFDRTTDRFDLPWMGIWNANGYPDTVPSTVSCWDWNEDLDDKRCSGEGCQPGTDLETQSAWWWMRDVWNWWLGAMGWFSYDRLGAPLNMYMHVGFTPYPNAQYSGCDYFKFSNEFALKDFIGHEFTHALIDHTTAHFESFGQSGSLEESMADIFGTFAEMYNRNDPADPYLIDWVIGDDWGPGNHEDSKRDLSDPSRYDNQPERYSQYYTYLPDNGGVHKFCGIPNLAAYLIINGGTYNTIPMPGALGWGKASWLFYSLLDTLPNNANFLMARNQAVHMAKYWSDTGWGGFNATDLCTVRNAYAAVELGSRDLDCNGIDDELWMFDNDHDGVANIWDNCMNIPNPGQENRDRDGLGDACDPDNDNDGANDDVDNCPEVANNQDEDWNSNGVGDACDDTDNDGVMDLVDKCRTLYDPSNLDSDDDGIGDICDTDKDQDGVEDNGDNCRTVYNPDQENADGDGYGDACDLCPYDYSTTNTDIDHDGKSDYCDDDMDGDEVYDDGDASGTKWDNVCMGGNSSTCDDNCPEVPNVEQTDLDWDAIGTACETEQETPTGETQVTPGKPHKLPVRTSHVPFAADAPRGNAQTNTYLPLGYQMEIMVDMGISFVGMIVDSGGEVVVHGQPLTYTQNTQVFKFKPAPYMSTSGILSTVNTSLGEAQDVGYIDQLAPGILPNDGIRYWLEIMPGPEAVAGQTYTLTVGTRSYVPSWLYLPVTIR